MHKPKIVPEGEQGPPPLISDRIYKEIQAVGMERRAYRRMLEEYVPRVGYEPPEKPKILILGCEAAYEAAVLSSYFGGEPYGKDSPDVQVVGISQSSEEVEAATLFNQTFDFEAGIYVSPDHYKFRRREPTNLEGLIGGRFDIVTLRNKNLYSGYWVVSFLNARRERTPEGIFIGTTMDDTMSEYLRSMLKIVGYEILLDEENQHSMPLTESFGIDRQIVIAR